MSTSPHRSERAEYPFPINRTTLKELYSLDLDELVLRRSSTGPERRIRPNERRPDPERRRRDLYEKFYLNYTASSGGSNQPAESRRGGPHPVRTNTDDRYFTDTVSGHPRHGYTAMFERMLDSPNIKVDSGRVRAGMAQGAAHVVYTGHRRLLRLPVRQTAVPLLAVRARASARHATVQSVGTVQLPERPCLHPDYGVQAPDGRASGTRCARVSAGGRGPYYRFPPRRQQRSTSATAALANKSRT